MLPALLQMQLNIMKILSVFVTNIKFYLQLSKLINAQDYYTLTN